MLALPACGFARSMTTHNVRLDVLCDWLEGSVLFGNAPVSKADVVDILIENEIYDSQDFANELLGDAWVELQRRNTLLGDGYPVVIEARRLKARHSWSKNPAHSFCLALSLAEWLPAWAQQFGRDYTKQGELFELLVAESIAKSLPDWSVHPTGWKKTKPVKLPGVITALCDWLGESATGNRDRWTRNSANEAGLDLVCIRRMADGRPGIPLYLLQCASGVTGNSSWKNKLRTPDLKTWGKLVDFAVRPKRGFATPFAFMEDDFRHYCLAVDGLLLDRYRLLAPSTASTGWLSRSTSVRICAWLRPRIRELPTAQTAVVG
jgi:hypothetical protein